MIWTVRETASWRSVAPQRHPDLQTKFSRCKNTFGWWKPQQMSQHQDFHCIFRENVMQTWASPLIMDHIIISVKMLAIWLFFTLLCSRTCHRHQVTTQVTPSINGYCVCRTLHHPPRVFLRDGVISWNRPRDCWWQRVCVEVLCTLI